MQLELLTPAKSVFSGEVKLVQLPGSDGSFEVLKNHAPIISALTEGNLKVESISGEIFNYTVSGGVVEVLKNQIVVLVESIE